MNARLFQEQAFRMLWKLSGRRPSLDSFLTRLMKHRHYLPVVDAGRSIPHFHDTEVRIRQCPLGEWSTPIVDVFVVTKAALGFGTKRILELGSYRGDTARLLAENTPDDVRITTVDVDPQHGGSYRDSEIAHKITRKVGAISSSLFSADEKFDLIFVDANHDLDSAASDTEVAFGVLDEPGVILWHDYHHESFFHGMSGVPEALAKFLGKYAIVSIGGTRLAMYSSYPGWETASAQRKPSAVADVWTDTTVKG